MKVTNAFLTNKKRYTRSGEYSTYNKDVYYSTNCPGRRTEPSSTEFNTIYGVMVVGTCNNQLMFPIDVSVAKGFIKNFRETQTELGKFKRVCWAA